MVVIWAVGGESVVGVRWWTHHKRLRVDFYFQKIKKITKKSRKNKKITQNLRKNQKTTEISQKKRKKEEKRRSLQFQSQNVIFHL